MPTKYWATSGEDRYHVVQGSTLSFRFSLVDELGDTTTDFDGDEALACEVTRGDGSASLCSPTATWDATASPALVVDISLAAEDSADLLPGQYRVYLTVGTATKAIAFLVVEPGVNTATRPATYVSSSEWRKAARPILALVGLPFDDGAIDQALAQAREDLDGLIAEQYAASFQDDAGAARSARESMEALLAANSLDVTTPVKKFCTFKAAWYLLAFTPGTKDSAVPLAQVRERLAQEADDALRGLVAYVGDVRVSLGGQIRLVR